MFTRTAHHYVIASTIFAVLQWSGWFGFVHCTTTVGGPSPHAHDDWPSTVPVSESATAARTTAAEQWPRASTISFRQYTRYAKRMGRPKTLARSTWPSRTTVYSAATSSESTPSTRHFRRFTLPGTGPTSAATVAATRTAHHTTTARSHSKRPKTGRAHDVLVLVHKPNSQISGVREQFYRLIETYGIPLANVTIDFNTIDGEYTPPPASPRATGQMNLFVSLVEVVAVVVVVVALLWVLSKVEAMKLDTSTYHAVNKAHELLLLIGSVCCAELYSRAM